MDPNWSTQEQEVINLLGELGAASPEYPAHKLAKRRATFIASIGAVSIVGAVGAKIAVFKFVSLLRHAIQMHKVVIGLEMAATAGLATYLGVTAYVHRQDLKDLFVPPSTPSLSTPLPTPDLPTLEVPPTIVPPTVTATPTPTLRPTASPTITSTFTLMSGTPGEHHQPTASTRSEPTGQPTEAPTHDDSGHHYGQTKTPRP